MEHIPFKIICRIADGELSQKEIELYINHWKSCRYCQKETEIQQSIMKATRKARLEDPSNNFTQSVMDIVNPSQKKKWFEWLLHNMGNIIAMALVLAFLGYILSIAETNDFHNDTSSKPKPVTEFVQIIQKGSNQINSYLTSKFPIQNISMLHMNTICYALLAIILLILIDRIAGYFFRQLKFKL
jgi:ABC-type glycerol-3-phosphate transport system permease component